MKNQEKQQLKNRITQAEVISFDVFDTLLYRRTNTPETIFDLVGRHFGVDGFRRLRMKCQDEAGRRARQAHQDPHADMDEIYAVLSEHTEIPVDWMSVKEYEIQMERDALTANREMLEMFRYAKAQGKRVIATSDMYLSAQFLSEVLEANGFVGFDHIYCSADGHKTKELFTEIARQEGVDCARILHIGNDPRDDVECPESLGMQAFLYCCDADLAKLKDCPCTDVDLGLYKILADQSKGFWYNLGVQAGGPVYMGLYRFLRDKVLEAKSKGQNVYFLSRGGYNLYQLFLRQGFDNVRYLYLSRRALAMACITEMTEEDLELLPPYDLNHTVGSLLDELCVDRSEIHHLEDAGLSGFDQAIDTAEKLKKFRKLYLYDREVFLQRCRIERKAALAYFSQAGLLDQDALCFDCDWQGSSQALLERFKKAVGCRCRHPFAYFGIRNEEKSRRQLRGMHYETWLCDFYTNYALQADLYSNVVLYELFFTAPHAGVFCYEENGAVRFESDSMDPDKQALLDGICDFVETGLSFVDRYEVETTPELSVGMLTRLIHYPTEEEAVTIGNLKLETHCEGEQDHPQYLAWLPEDPTAQAPAEAPETAADAAEEKEHPAPKIHWLEGFLKRPDVSDQVKKFCAKRYGRTYPEKEQPYHLEDDGSIRAYARWRKSCAARKEAPVSLSHTPLFSVVVPVYNTATDQLEDCIQSVLNQTYDRYELILVDDHSSWDNVVPVLKKYEGNEHVRVIYRTENGHISVATNDGIQAAKGDFIVFMDCDDFIEPDALYQFALLLDRNPELDFIYSDEDKVTEDRKIFHMPHFKPDWSPDLFLTMMYTNHLAAYRTSIVRQTGGLRSAYNGSQDYDFTLRFMELSSNDRVGHIPQVLYHWRERKESVAFAMGSKNYALEAARRTKEDYIRRNGLQAYPELIPGANQYRLVYQVVGQPLVSIIIPSKDNPGILRQCIDSIRAFTRYPNYEILVVDNGSSPENRAAIQRYLDQVGASYFYHKEDFNFSRMCNTGAAKASGQYLLFLNDDIEIFQPQWLERMLGQAQQKHVGAVGAKLFYPFTTRMQHDGVLVSASGPEHILCTGDDQYEYSFAVNLRDQDCLAVTGACLMLAKEKFDEIGGFDEGLAVAYNDVKLCFSLVRKGYYNVLRNDVVAYHHESLSRGSDVLDDKKLIRLQKELTRLRSDFPEFTGKDPFLNVNLERYSASLNPKNAYDRLVDHKIRADGSEGLASIDQVEVREKIRVIGWALFDDGTDPREIQRYLIARDPFGRTYRADVLPLERNDVAAHFDREIYRYAGFESVLDPEELRMDIIPYTLGVLMVDRRGKQQVHWFREYPITRRNRPRPLAPHFRKLEPFALHAASTDQVKWYVDALEHRDSFCWIRGFAFRPGNDHYRYGIRLILSDADGEAFQFEVHREERIDLAYTFVQEHFLLYTGFQCFIYDGILSPGKEYSLTIRLFNRFDPKDILDIPTGKTICL